MEEHIDLFDSVEIPNLDDLSVNPEDYGRLQIAFQELAEFCSYKMSAMECRKAGDIEDAKRLERKADRIHARLPLPWRW